MGKGEGLPACGNLPVQIRPKIVLLAPGAGFGTIKPRRKTHEICGLGFAVTPGWRAFCPPAKSRTRKKHDSPVIGNSLGLGHFIFLLSQRICILCYNSRLLIEKNLKSYLLLARRKLHKQQNAFVEDVLQVDQKDDHNHQVLGLSLFQ